MKKPPTGLELLFKFKTQIILKKIIYYYIIIFSIFQNAGNMLNSLLHLYKIKQHDKSNAITGKVF